jgi:hypothetical protein
MNTDCHEFWKEFIKKEDMFADPGFAELPTGSNISELG